jgi:glucose-6-phosphate dehydrogenase assembly protein OpcA
VEEAVTAPTLVRTTPKKADWQKIPDGMRALWRTCLSDKDGGDVARSLTINFLAVAAAADEPVLREAVDRLQHRSPGRAFLVVLDDKASAGQAELAATTRCHGNVRDIVLEEIVLRLPPSALAQVPGLIRPLMMNDLPNHLFWATRWPAHEVDFTGLANLCEHVVIDSRLFADPAADLKHVAAQRAAGRRISDVSWLRLRPWRRALAEAFERVPWTPGTATTATVRHGKNGLAAAHLLAEWLRSRLAATVNLAASGDPASASPDNVVVRTGGFEVELGVMRQQIRVHVTTPEHCYLPFTVPASRGTAGDLLAAAIDIG